MTPTPKLCTDERVGSAPGPVMPANAASTVLDSLVPLAVLGDRAAMAALLRGVSPSLLAIARRLLGASNPQVEDAVQEALMAFARALPAFLGGCSIQHYARQIGVRVALRVRARQRSAVPFNEEIALSVAPSPHHDSVQRRRFDLLATLLEKLRPEQAETLVLRLALDLSLEEVAEVTQVPVNTVRSRVRLAKRALAVLLQGKGEARDLLIHWGEP